MPLNKIASVAFSVQSPFQPLSISQRLSQLNSLTTKNGGILFCSFRGLWSFSDDEDDYCWGDEYGDYDGSAYHMTLFIIVVECERFLVTIGFWLTVEFQ